MALKITQSLVDDIDESPATSSVEFSHNGVSYAIDLNDAHQAELAAALEPFIRAGRRIGGKRGSRKSAPASSKTAAVRAWAIAQGRNVADRGRIPAEIIEAFDKAHA